MNTDPRHFQTFGFIVLRRFFDPAPLAAEIERALRDGLVDSADPSAGGQIRFRYVPMMVAETPVSLSLVHRLEAVASALLGGPVLPTRAKGVRYSGDTPWHADSDLPIASAGFAAYLEPLDANNGALRVLPGSHRTEYAEALRTFGATGMLVKALPSVAIATEPGDVIAFDEHLFHASYRPDWDGGHDVDRFPSYDPSWRASSRPAAARLETLGVYEMAARQESFARSRR